MADTYVPFSQPVEYISNDIQQYVPGEIYNPNSKTEYSHYDKPSHHMFCRHGHGWGHCKHGCCDPNQVPVGDGILILIALAMVYVLFKKFKNDKRRSNSIGI